MLGKDKKVFVFGLVASSFALVTTLKAQNYSYESYSKPYVTAGVNASKNRVEVMPLSSSSSGTMDFSSVYSDGVSVSYTNDRYPVGEVATRRKVMRMDTHQNSFKGSNSGGDWVVRIGEEEVVPLGFVDEEENKIDNLNQSRRLQYGNLLADEINVGGDSSSFSGSVVSSDGNYTYTDNQVVDEAELYAEYNEGNKAKYDDISRMSKRVKEQKSYPWERSAANVNRSGVSAGDRYSEAYAGQSAESPWGAHSVSGLGASEYKAAKPIVNTEILYANDSVKNIKIERKSQLQQRQQAYIAPQITKNNSRIESFQKVSTSAVAPETYEEETLFEQYADGAVTSRVEEVAAVEKKVAAPAVEAKRPLLVPIEDDTFDANEASNEGIVAEYKVDVVSVAPPVQAINVDKKDTGISLTELKINFKPFKADLSVKTVKWLKEFSKKAAVNFDNIVEIRISPNIPHIQNERLLMLKGVLNSNGVYDQQMRIVANRKSADSVVIKVIEAEDEEQVDVVDYKDLSGSYYYYY